MGTFRAEGARFFGLLFAYSDPNPKKTLGTDEHGVQVPMSTKLGEHASVVGIWSQIVGSGALKKKTASTMTLRDPSLRKWKIVAIKKGTQIGLSQ